MPFDHFLPRTLAGWSIRANAPAASGIYGLTNAREWIYIGQTDDIQASLLNHLHESNSALMKKEPTGFVYELCDSTARSARKDRLISEYEPACNRITQKR